MRDLTKLVMFAEPRRCGIGSGQRVTPEGHHVQQTVNNRERGMRSERRGAKTFIYKLFFAPPVRGTLLRLPERAPGVLMS